MRSRLTSSPLRGSARGYVTGTSIFMFLLCLHFDINTYLYLSQLVFLGPKELGDWEKPKPEPKRKAKPRKTVEEKEDEDKEDEDEDEDEEENKAGKTKEVYKPKPTRHPRGKTSNEPAD